MVIGKRKLRKFLKLLRCFWDGFVNTIRHDGVEHAGYMAFLGLLSLFPFLIFVVAVAGFLGSSEVGSYFVRLLMKTLPANMLSSIEPRITEIVSGPPQGLLTIAIVGVIWTASSAVEGLRTTLNRAYRVATPPAYIWRRLLSIVQFLFLSFILINSMLVITLTPIFMKRFGKVIELDFKLLEPFWNYVRYGVSSVILFLVVSALYVMLPNIKQKWKRVMPGAVTVVILWIISAEILTAYLQNFHQVNLVYGSLAGIIVTLLFFYITALIFIYGAEVNYLIEKMLGHKFRVKEKIKPGAVEPIKKK